MAKKIDIEDFQAFFNQYKDFVYKTAYFIVKDHHKAEDVMQEVFINAYKSKGTYNPNKGEYSTWLRKITVNQCFRKNKGNDQNCSSIEEMEEKGRYLPDESNPIAENIALIDEIKCLFGSLGSKYRTALILRCVDGLKYGEISEILKIPLGTVKSRINRAIVALRDKRKQLNEDGSKT